MVLLHAIASILNCRILDLTTMDRWLDGGRRPRYDVVSVGPAPRLAPTTSCRLVLCPPGRPQAFHPCYRDVVSPSIEEKRRKTPIESMFILTLSKCGLKGSFLRAAKGRHG